MRWLLSLPDEERTALVATLTPSQTVAANDWLFRYQALPHQLEPEGDWFIWVMQWGAGSGKTFTGAQQIRKRIDSGLWRTVNVGGPTWTDTMRTMVQGTAQAPGLMGSWPPHQRPVLRSGKDDPHLRCHNGAKIQLFAAQKADRFRGPAADGAWFDEIDSWKPEQMTRDEAFMLAEQRIRSGPDPRIICTSTPRPGRLVASILKRADSVVTRATMYDNASNLNSRYVLAQEAKYAGTRLGRQELEGELLEDTENAIVTLQMIDAARLTSWPELKRVVIGIDPFGGGGDACGLAAMAEGIDGEGYILADRTCRLGPDGWAKRAIEMAVEFGATCLVPEKNYGGDMVTTTLRHAMKALGVTDLRIVGVWASKSKAARFEPMAAFYERGEMHHCGDFPELEDEICRFTPQTWDGTGSPNRADAAIHAHAELFPQRKGLSPSDIYGDPLDDEEERAWN